MKNDPSIRPQHLVEQCISEGRRCEYALPLGNGCSKYLFPYMAWKHGSCAAIDNRKEKK